MGQLPINEVGEVEKELPEYTGLKKNLVAYDESLCHTVHLDMDYYFPVVDFSHLRDHFWDSNQWDRLWWLSRKD